MRMKQAKRAVSVLLAAALLTAMLPGTALAESRKKVGKVELDIFSNIRIGDSSEDVEVFTDNEHCTVDYVEVTNGDGDDWTRSKPPIIEITLTTTDDDYYFASKTSSTFKMRMHGGSYEDIKFMSADYERDSDKTVVLVKARFVYDKDNDSGSAIAPDSADWSEAKDGFGYWDEASEAKYYQVQLLKSGSVTGETKSVYDTKYNFAGMITQAGSYRFRVRTVERGTNSKSEWVSSDTWYVSAEEANALGANSGSWQKSADGTRWWWRYNDGSWPADQWLSIGGAWYYFDASGYMCTGWVLVGGNYYYLDTNTGAMLSNTRTPDGFWVNQDGVYIPNM